MRPVMILAAAFWFVIAPAALAGGGSAKPEAEADPESASRIDMPPLVAPLIVGGRLKGYVYITLSIQAGAVSDVWAIRNRTPFVQDAFIREVYLTPLAGAAIADIDTKALADRLAARARAAVPGTPIKDVKVSALQIVGP